MTKTRFAQPMLIILLLLFALPALAGDVVYYDSKGKMLDMTAYEKAVKDRAPKIDKIMQDGYRDNTMKLADPILLRKKRMEQWKKYRESRRKFKA